MSDPWADVRERTRIDTKRLDESGGHGGHIGAHKDRKRLLADADALLVVVRAMNELPALRSDYIGVDGIEVAEITGIPTKDYGALIELIATLPEYLK